MATVTGLTAARMQEIIDTTIQTGYIDGFGHLILVTYDLTEIDAGLTFASVPDASETVEGIVELATTAEATAGVDTVRAVTPAGLAVAVGTLVPDATTTVKGKVELATTGEVTTGTDTTRAVTSDGVKAAIDALKALIWPVGAYYMSDSVSTSPATLLGFGTWSAVQGKFLVGQDGSHTVSTEGGAATHTIASGNLPTHTHAVNIDSGTVSADHAHYVYNVISPSGSGSGAYFESWPGGTGNRNHYTAGITVNHVHNVNGNTGNGGFANTAINHEPPWRAVYIWRRTA